MGTLKHLGSLLREVSGFARANKVWWLYPALALLLLIALVVVVTTWVTPLIYPLF